MSSPSTASGSAPKSMSSRLLTMKFMQRAAASTPLPSSPTPDEPSPKRQKKSLDSPSRSNSTVDAMANQQAIQAAMDAEEAKRQLALEKQAAEAGDTRWVLSFDGQDSSSRTPDGALRVIQAGYANIDVPTPQQFRSLDEEDMPDRPAVVGRRSFGKFNKALEREQGTLESSSSSESDSSESDSDSDANPPRTADDDDDPMNELIRSTRTEAASRLKAERKAKRKAEDSQARDLARKRKKKEVRLNTPMTSLTGRQDREVKVKCFRCGGPHMIAKCPREPAEKRGYRGADDGPKAKARKIK